MELLAIFTLIVTVSLNLAFDLRGTGNYTLQQQQQEKEARLYSRIFKGQPAEADRFHYQVGLRRYTTNIHYGLCGGSLISEIWVLTAAHCVHGVGRVVVQLGSIQFAKPQIKHNIDRQDIIEHREYNSTTLQHDIAVIKIRKVPEAIEPIRLPAYVGNVESYDDAEAVLAGWGHTSDSSTVTTPELQYATLTVITNKKCAATYGKIRVYDGKLCASSSQRASGCVGDSGGPLALVNGDDQPIQIGILSFVDTAGCQLGYPNGFTRVDYYLKWISENTGIIV